MSSILKLPRSFEEDLAKFREETQRFKSGALSAAEYRSFRVPRRVYEQREADTYMLRARCPAGVVLPQQMRALASVSRRYGNGVLHVTTRQDIQVHRVLLDQIHPALVELHATGLSTRRRWQHGAQHCRLLRCGGLHPRGVRHFTLRDRFDGVAPARRTLLPVRNLESGNYPK